MKSSYSVEYLRQGICAQVKIILSPCSFVLTDTLFLWGFYNLCSDAECYHFNKDEAQTALFKDPVRTAL